MDWSSDGESPPAAAEGSGDSELICSDAAIFLPHCCDDGDDDDAESCNHDMGDLSCRGYESSDDGNSSSSDEDSTDRPPMSWGSWLVEIAAGCKCPEVDPVQGEQVAEKPAATGAEDRLFWEACLADGYP